MKGTKDDEKMVSPMFPRLHVNDTEKGGPRPPPRNKMALYEQLSVPTQRFNPGSASGFSLPSSNTGTSIPSQGGRQERMLFSSFSMPSTTAAHETSVGAEHPSSAGEPGSFYTQHISNLRNTYANQLGNEDHCRVPTFVDSGLRSHSNKDEHSFDTQRLNRFSSNHLAHSMVTLGNSLPKAASAICNSSVQMQNSKDKPLKRTTAVDLRSREENLREPIGNKDDSDYIVPCPLPKEKISERIEHSHQSANQENLRSPDDNSQELHDCSVQLNQDRDQFLQGKDAVVDDISSAPLEDAQKMHVLRLKADSFSRASTGNGHRSPDEPLEDNSGGAFLGREVDRNDDVSETSMVDSLSGLDISPDDVVGVIGKKHFWKARRAIVNQQRLFAVQIFELHRLIKVQRLIAGSPHLLLRDGNFLSKHSLKSSPAKKPPSEHPLKPPELPLKPRVIQKPSENIECAAENVVGKSPHHAVTDNVNKGLPSQLIYGQYSGSPSPAPMAGDDKLGWCCPPPPGNQWLIPVMLPSEGLVYKPWSGPCPPTTGFVAPVYGSCGPINLPPAYGIPASHPQGFGQFSGAPFAQTCVPPYNIPIMNPAISASAVEQVRPLAGPRPYRHAEQVVAIQESSPNMHSRNSCNVSNQKSEGMSCFPKFQTCKEREIQGSTASSSPSERVEGAGTGNVSDGRDALPLFPVTPALQGLHGENVDKQHARVIRVVPHNPRSAPESAARIFQSIQEERKQYDSSN